MFEYGKFKSHSGLELDFKINCDILTDKDLDSLAKVYSLAEQYGHIISIPTGGDRFAKALSKHLNPSSPNILIVDDVMTTGNSMSEAKRKLLDKGVIHSEIKGVVIFNRPEYNDFRVNNHYWIEPMFNYNFW